MYLGDGPTIHLIALDTVGVVTGVTDAHFLKQKKAAKKARPVSRALAGP